MKIKQKHENISLASSATRTLQIPAGGKIQSCVLYFKTGAGAAAAEADIRSELSNIRVSAGGKDIISCTFIQLLDLYESLGTEVHTNTAVDGCVELNLGRLIYNDPAVRDIFGWGTKDVNSIQVQITAGTLVNVASFEAYTERQFGAAADEVLGTYCRFISYPQTFNSTGDHQVQTLPRDTNTSYLALLVDDGASGTIAEASVKIGSVTLTDKVPLNVNKQFLSNNRMEQPSGYYVHAFCDGSLLERMPMAGVNDFSVTHNFSVAPGAAGYAIAALTVENFPANLK